jgi:hypothetical protein
MTCRLCDMRHHVIGFVYLSKFPLTSSAGLPDWHAFRRVPIRVSGVQYFFTAVGSEFCAEPTLETERRATAKTKRLSPMIVASSMRSIYGSVENAKAASASTLSYCFAARLITVSRKEEASLCLPLEGSRWLRRGGGSMQKLRFLCQSVIHL